MTKSAKKSFDLIKWVSRIGVAVTVVLAGVGLYVGSSAFFEAERWPINVVKVTGELRYTDPAQIEDVVVGQVAGGFFALDMDYLQESIEALEWVAVVDARRVWRDTLLLEVSEHVPFARWGEGQLISLEGVVYVSDKRERFEHLPQLIGPIERKYQVMEKFKHWSTQLNDLGLNLVVVELNHRGAWQLELESGMNLKLGTTRTQQRLNRFTSVYEHHFAKDVRKLAVVDLRYTNGMAVTWISADA